MEHPDIVKLFELAKSTGIEREKACLELYTLYHEKMRAYASYLLKKSFNDPDVDTLTQNTFVKFFLKGLEAYQNKYYLILYLRGIMLNEFRDNLRKAKSQKHRLVDVDESRTAHRIADNCQPDSRLISSDYQNQITQFIAQSNPSHRTALSLRYEGYSYEEIQQRTGLPAGTICSILGRSRAALKAKFNR